MRVVLILWILLTIRAMLLDAGTTGRSPRGETCHARRLDIVDTADDTSDAT